MNEKFIHRNNFQRIAGVLQNLLGIKEVFICALDLILDTTGKVEHSEIKPSLLSMNKWISALQRAKNCLHKHILAYLKGLFSVVIPTVEQWKFSMVNKRNEAYGET